MKPAAALLAIATALDGHVAAADRITVFAASSTGAALQDVAAAFSGDTGHEVAVSPAGSSTLARQVLLGAPADVILSASGAWMDLLEQDGRIAQGTRRDLLTNVLVLIAHGEVAPFDPAVAPTLSDRLGAGRLAIALPDAVPAGQYAKAALSALGLWEAVADRLAPTDNVRAALALVALGEAPLGIVYATDARAEPRVSVVYAFPPDSHPPIVYPVAAVAGRVTPAVTAFLQYLAGPEARDILTGHGFGVAN